MLVSRIGDRTLQIGCYGRLRSVVIVKGFSIVESAHDAAFSAAECILFLLERTSLHPPDSLLPLFLFLFFRFIDKSPGPFAVSPKRPKRRALKVNLSNL